jgi:glycosyltransferase involved in cell wall biosynthesis
VVFPSLYEGFGLPVLEAMALGTPVITSTAASLPEVAGEAALLVDPFDVRALARAMNALDADADLVAGLARAGLAQAEKFSIAAYRARLAGFYHQLLGTSPSPRVCPPEPAPPSAVPPAIAKAA